MTTHHPVPDLYSLDPKRRTCEYHMTEMEHILQNATSVLSPVFMIQGQRRLHPIRGEKTHEKIARK